MKKRQGVVVLLGILALGPILAMTSCGPSVDLTGLGNGGNTDGTGIGPVAGFGSVIVDGVGYDDSGIDNTNFFDDHGRTKAELEAGMMVAITGTINGADGTADNITVLRHVDGPMDDNGVDLSTNRLKVMGQDVVVDTSTVFDNGVTNLADLRTLQGANVNHPELEVHGPADNNGVIHATFIHKWADDRAAGRDVQVRGTVAGPPTATTFVIGRKTVDYSGAPGGLPPGVIAGSFVEVKGTLGALDNALVANLVKLEDAIGGQPSGSRVEVEGYVNRVTTPGTSFEMIGPNGIQTVIWAGTTPITGGTGADIRAGIKVEVEGTRKVGGALAAAKIEIRRANNVRMESNATSITGVSLTVFGKTVKVNALTRYKDSSIIHLRTFGQANILVGDSLGVSASLDNTTVPASIVATRVERIGALAADRRILQGPVDSFLPGGPDLFILGIDVLGGTAAFSGTDGTPLTQAQFFQVLADNRAAGKTTIVKARGTDSNPMSANALQIEPTIDN
ncbi:DUF5666 domain-containing protein [Candidatus Deferrimicrobium sp.]|uniref:DUF5666 domain-containing protein n=1 Tax=Candidatus Deferrimicrobium sp. TaxID=3060586 RepID=UPI003C67C15E